MLYIYIYMEHLFLMFLDHTQRRNTVGSTPLGEWSAHRRDLYLTTHNIHNRQTSMAPVGFEPTVSAGERPQTYALDRAATETAWSYYYTEPKLRVDSAARISEVRTHAILSYWW